MLGQEYTPKWCAHTHLYKGHVDLVHVGSLLSVHFDADKVVTQDFANFLVFERLPLHNMAPVAR